MLFGYLLLLLLTVPVLELFLIFKLGKLIGFPLTVGFILLTGLIGYTLAKVQGLQVIQKIRTEINQGQMPADSMVDGVIILIAAAVLCTPGYLTDIFGFLLLTPKFREQLKKWLMLRITASVESRRVSTVFFSTGAPRPPNPGVESRRQATPKDDDDDVIDV